MEPTPQLISAMRDNNLIDFLAQLDRCDSSVLNEPNPHHFTNWFPGVGATLLQIASFARRDFAEPLLQRGADLDFHSACGLGKVEAVKSALEDEAVMVTQVDTFFPLQFALGQPEVARCLLEHGDDPNRSFEKVGWYEWEEKAVGLGISDWRPLHMVALGRGTADHTRVAATLHEFGAEMDAKSSPHGEAPLHMAAVYDRTEIIRWFVANGSDVNLRTRSAVEASMIEQLYDVSSIAPFTASDAQTPLMSAAGEGHLSSVRELLSLGADVSLSDSQGFTALHYAAGSYWQEQPEIVTMLIEHGAAPGLAASNGTLASDVAENKGYDSVLKLLR